MPIILENRRFTNEPTPILQALYPMVNQHFLPGLVGPYGPFRDERGIVLLTYD